jgi:P27 family predicted phage terminase small subunit
MAKRIKIPDHLSHEMKDFYKKITRDYDLEAHHLIILTKACECLDRAEQARKEVAQDGLTVKDRYGSVKPHPCCKIEIDSKNTARLLLRELGLDLEPPGGSGRGPRQY